MAVSYDGRVPAQYRNNTSLTASLTTSGSNRVVLAGTLQVGSATVTGITYAGASLTNFVTVTKLRAWKKDSAASGANNVVWSFSSYDAFGCGAAAFSGCDDTGTSTGTPVSGSASTADPSTGSVTCPSNGAIYGGLYSQYSNPTGSVTAGTALDGMVQLGGGRRQYAQAYRTDTGAITGHTNSGAQNVEYFGIPINPLATAASGVPRRAFPKFLQQF